MLGSREEVISRDSRFRNTPTNREQPSAAPLAQAAKAPKLLLTEDRRGALHPDAALPDAEAARHWFVKFARNRASKTDRKYCAANSASTEAFRNWGWIPSMLKDCRWKRGASPACG